MGWIAGSSRRHLVAAVVIVGAALENGAPTIGQSEAAASIAAPAGADFFGLTPQFAVSPAGDDIVFVAAMPGASPVLWVRPIRGGTARALPGTAQASYPFWSPDGREVGFFADAKLKRVAVTGGPSVVVCDAPTGRGGSWNRAGVIVFASGIGDPLRKVAAAGGVVTAATTLDTPRENSHRWPSFLPDGTHVLFWAGAGTAPPTLKVAPIDGGAAAAVAPATSNGAYANGRVFYAQGSRLVAQPFDLERRQATGAAVDVASPVSGDAGSFFASFAVTDAGAVIVTRGNARPLVLTWFDRQGRRLGSVGAPGQYTNVNISPDARTIAVSLTAGSPPNRDVYVLDARTGDALRLTTDAAVDATPVWSPDAAELIFSAQRAGPYQMYRRRAVAGGADQLLMASTVATIATDWSTTGRLVAYTRASPATGLDVWVLAIDGGPPTPLVESPAADDNATFRPGGDAVAYQSGVSGRDEIYLRAFPLQEDGERVSAAGGTQPRWRADGQELFYLAPDGSVMAVAVARTAGRWSVGPPRTLVPATMSLVIRQAYAVTPDGERVLTPVVDATNPPVISIMPRWP